MTATYQIPSTGTQVGSSEITLDDLQIDRASNGAPRGRAIYTIPKKTFSIKHAFVKSSDKTALETFYNAWRAGTTPFTTKFQAFNFTWVGDGAIHSCIFASPPQYELGSSMYWDISTELIET